MTQTSWGHDLVLLVPQMDREHEELIAKANEFSVAVDGRAARAELELRVTQLIEGFQSHFDSEEGLMRSNGYPGLKLHTGEHRRLLDQMTGFRNDLRSGSVNLCDALGHFVRFWTEQHIKGPDTHFAHFLHKERPA